MIANAIATTTTYKVEEILTFKDGTMMTLGQKTIERPIDRPCLLYTSPSPRDQRGSRMPSSA